MLKSQVSAPPGSKQSSSRLHGTVTEQHLHAYEHQRSKTVTAIRTSMPPAEAGTRRVESASERRTCEREKCNVHRNQTKFNGSITTTRADLESSGLGQQRRDRGENRRATQPACTDHTRDATTPATYQQATATLNGRRFAEEKFTSGDVQVQKIDRPPNAKAQKCLRKRHRQPQGNGTVAAAGTAGATAGTAGAAAGTAGATAGTAGAAAGQQMPK